MSKYNEGMLNEIQITDNNLFVRTNQIFGYSCSKSETSPRRNNIQVNNLKTLIDNYTV